MLQHFFHYLVGVHCTIAGSHRPRPPPSKPPEHLITAKKETDQKETAKKEPVPEPAKAPAAKKDTVPEPAKAKAAKPSSRASSSSQPKPALQAKHDTATQPAKQEKVNESAKQSMAAQEPSQPSQSSEPDMPAASTSCNHTILVGCFCDCILYMSTVVFTCMKFPCALCLLVFSL